MPADIYSPRPPRVAICAIIKDEADGLLEWIAYHRVVGVDHFFIYDNGSTDGTGALLHRLAARGIVTAIDWVQPTVERPLSFPEMLNLLAAVRDPAGVDWRNAVRLGPQMTAYNHAIWTYGDRADWFLFIDADEFFVCRHNPDLPSFAARFGPEVPAVAVNWRYFGSAGQLEPDGRLVIERFTRCAPRAFDGHVHMKTLARPADLDRMRIHGGSLRRGGYVNDRGEPVQLDSFAFTPTISHAVAQINHYSVKSFAEFRKKRSRGLAPYADDHPNKWEGITEEYFRRQDLNDEEDTDLLAFVPRVKAEMAALLSQSVEPAAMGEPGVAISAAPGSAGTRR